MCIDVIASVLNIVLDHKDRALGPKLALGDRLDHLAQGCIVLSDHGRRSQLANPSPCSVVVGQVHGNEMRQVVFGLELLESLDKGLGSIQIAVVQVVRAVVGIKVTFEHRYLGTRRFARL